MTGFPFLRSARRDFTRTLGQSGWRAASANLSLLCMHQAVEGTTVGLHNYTFRNGRDTIRVRDIPDGFHAVLTGHIHRHQILTAGPSGRTPVI